MKPRQKTLKATSVWSGKAPRTGAQMAAVREDAGLSQAQLAARIGYTRGYITNAENGHQSISWQFVRSYLYDGCDAKPDDAVRVLEAFANERGFVILKGSDKDTTGAIVATIERTARIKGEKVACVECGARASETCSGSCDVGKVVAVERELQGEGVSP